MSILNRVLNVFVGDKSRKDLKSIQPIVSQILAEEKKLSDISNDELRSKTKEFKDQIQDIRSPFQEKINTILAQIDQSNDIDEKESLTKYSYFIISIFMILDIHKTIIN